MTNKIKVKFEGNPEAVQQFMSWLCGQGEQDYWTYQEYQDEPVTVSSFEYDFEKQTITGFIDLDEDDDI